MNRPFNLVLAVIFVILAAGFSTASDIYVAQNAAGGNTGADCADAHAAAWFNSPANWGSSGGQIGPGTVAHLCGTITSPLTAQGSGTAGKVIEILFESGAQLSTGAFNPAAIELGGTNYILVDGGTPCGTGTSCATSLSGTGVIQNTANGTGLANNVGTIAVDLGQGSCGNNIEVRNLLILNLYVKTSTSDEGAGASNSEGVFGYACGNNILIHDNTATYAHMLLGVAPSNGGSNYQIYNNALQNATWGINAQIGDPGIVGTNLLIYNNDINNGTAWSDPSGVYHLDGIFVFGQNSTGYWNGAYIYNNYVHGDWVTPGSGQCPTGFMYINQNLQNFYIFNNVYALTGDGTCNGQLTIGYQDNNFFIYNNTFQGQGGSSSGCCGIGDAGSGDTNITIKNNILAHIVTGENLSHASAMATIDYNDNYDILGSGQPCNWDNASTCASSFSAWQGSGNDTHGVYADPKLSSTFALQSGSAAIGVGENLYSVCNGQPNPGLGALCYDKSGNARPQTGAWDAGAYQFSTGSQAPAAPTGLAAVVQ